MDATHLLEEAPATLSPEQLMAAITTLSAHMNAAEYRLISLIGEWDQRDMAGIGGGCTMVQWLGWQCGIAGNAARERLRVARAVRNLPLLRARFKAGEVSWSKVRAITRVATPSNESLLLGYAAAATAAQLETIVRGYRRVERINDPDTLLRQQRERGLRWHFDDDGMLLLEGRFPPEEGALILKAIEAVQDRLYRATDEQNDPAVSAETPWAARRADALVQLVEHGVGSAGADDSKALTGGERHLVVLHVPATDPADKTAAPAELEDGPAIATVSARRIACDASVVTHQHDSNGATIGVGRKSRTLPWWLRRALKHRDGGCRFPGCSRSHNTDAHHIRHWADGGETTLDNLVLLCRQHHRYLHEQGWSCEMQDGQLRFLEPDGRQRPNVQPQQPGDLQTLVGLHNNSGLRIDQHTCAGGWDGGPADLGEAVRQLWSVTNSPADRGVSAETPA